MPLVVIKQKKGAGTEVLNVSSVKLSRESPVASGTASPGVSDQAARADHAHPAQATVTGNAGTATKLKTARTITVSGGVTSTAVSFDGSQNITIPVTALDMNKASAGTLTVGRGGTGRTDGKVAALATARTIDGVSFNGSANVTHYATCSTASGTAAKIVALTDFTLVTGATVTVRFTITNTAANPTLNVNNTGAKAIRYRNAAISAGYLAANRTYDFVYDGSSWQLVGDLDTLRAAATIVPKAPGTAVVGTSAKYAREDHVHPAQAAAVLHSASGARTAAIAANAAFTVPSYTVGSGRLQVFLDGLLCAGGTNATTCVYMEMGTAGTASTSIKFHQAISTDMEILARVQ